MGYIYPSIEISLKKPRHPGTSGFCTFIFMSENSKEAFQVERIALFSDAVFAIAITLLIIEIKVPEISKPTDEDLLNAMLSLIPKFIGFLISFFVIGLYWVSHHRMLKYVDRAGQRLIWANLLFLLPIIVLPFSTAFFSQYFTEGLHVPLAVYTLNICITGFFSYRLWGVVANPKYKLGAGLTQTLLHYNQARAMVIPGIFILALLLSFINPWIPCFVAPLTPVGTMLIQRYYTRKFPEQILSHLG
jgi:uncharacterized membrane protein